MIVAVQFHRLVRAARFLSQTTRYRRLQYVYVKLAIILAGLSFAGCEGQASQQNDWQKERDAVLQESEARQRNAILDACTRRSSDWSGGPIWVGVLQLAPDESGIGSPLRHYDASLQKAVKQLYDVHNDLAAQYNKIEDEFARLKVPVSVPYIRELIYRAEQGVKQASDLNRRNIAILSSRNYIKNSRNSDEMYLLGPGLNIGEVGLSFAYIKYLRDGDLNYFKEASSRLLSSFDPEAWRRPSARLDDSASLPG